MITEAALYLVCALLSGISAGILIAVWLRPGRRRLQAEPEPPWQAATGDDAHDHGGDDDETVGDDPPGEGEGDERPDEDAEDDYRYGPASGQDLTIHTAHYDGRPPRPIRPRAPEPAPGPLNPPSTPPRPTDPTPRPTDPPTRPAEPPTRPAEPPTRPAEPPTRPAEPPTRPPEPGPQFPCVRLQEPAGDPITCLNGDALLARLQGRLDATFAELQRLQAERDRLQARVIDLEVQLRLSVSTEFSVPGSVTSATGGHIIPGTAFVVQTRLLREREIDVDDRSAILRLTVSMTGSGAWSLVAHDVHAELDFALDRVHIALNGSREGPVCIADGATIAPGRPLEVDVTVSTGLFSAPGQQRPSAEAGSYPIQLRLSYRLQGGRGAHLTFPLTVAAD